MRITSKKSKLVVSLRECYCACDPVHFTTSRFRRILRRALSQLRRDPANLYCHIELVLEEIVRCKLLTVATTINHRPIPNTIGNHLQSEDSQDSDSTSTCSASSDGDEVKHKQKDAKSVTLCIGGNASTDCTTQSASSDGGESTEGNIEDVERTLSTLEVTMEVTDSDEESIEIVNRIIENRNRDERNRIIEFLSDIIKENDSDTVEIEEADSHNKMKSEKEDNIDNNVITDNNVLLDNNTNETYDTKDDFSNQSASPSLPPGEHLGESVTIPTVNHHDDVSSYIPLQIYSHQDGIPAEECEVREEVITTTVLETSFHNHHEEEELEEDEEHEEFQSLLIVEDDVNQVAEEDDEEEKNKEGLLVIDENYLEEEKDEVEEEEEEEKEEEEEVLLGTVEPLLQTEVDEMEMEEAEEEAGDDHTTQNNENSMFSEISSISVIIIYSLIYIPILQPCIGYLSVYRSILYSKVFM